jgi:hypothetical protein
MKFSSKGEMTAAVVVTARWLPQLLRRVEAGVKALGVEITKKVMLKAPGETICPTLRLKHGNWEIELRLKNALEDFLLVDREEEPVRLDPRVLDVKFAEKKLGEVVEGRLAMVRAFKESRGASEVAEKLRKHASKQDRIRIWVEEP